MHILIKIHHLNHFLLRDFSKFKGSQSGFMEANRYKQHALGLHAYSIKNDADIYHPMCQPK